MNEALTVRKTGQKTAISSTVNGGVPRSAYIHIPFCRRRCYYCDFPISVLGNKTDINTSAMIKNYVEVLCQEICATPALGQPLETVFFGGGTPSLLPVPYLKQILTVLSQHFGITSEAEISLEIDPGTFTEDQLQGYLQAGVNRVSLGVQSFDDRLLQICGRFHTQKDIFTAVDVIRRLEVPNFSLDLISGLPHQTLEQWQYSLTQAIIIAPNHLSCYDLVLEPVTAFGKFYQPGEKPLPSDEMTAKMYRTAQQFLTQAGFNHYEVSNYGQPGYQCRHNRVYWENRAYYGFGMGAASYVNLQRFTRPKTRREYYTWVEQLIDSQGKIDCSPTPSGDQLLETLMLGLRLAEGVDLSVLTQQYGEAILNAICQSLSPYSRQGWIEGIDQQGKKLDFKDINDFYRLKRIRLTDPDGFLFSNTILSTLFKNLSELECLEV
ncbi:oxygen-independent coproporphyrinogen III oxidase [Gloeothece citriformis PCC 7424]|uniref:Heme chaperone HemW n=1 Tax=Gloeothece citriformis (strain PCC 7424) TaxID=65393 RepID=B7K957_GLOC7|nr:radical SAM family heme chaperone HemW [Gloeothece citriformis]ACK72826.1 oxygen-independent coproporphyrinogen III oxidase [Gloeothece citriformis PCC 7424]